MAILGSLTQLVSPPGTNPTNTGTTQPNNSQDPNGAIVQRGTSAPTSAAGGNVRIDTANDGTPAGVYVYDSQSGQWVSSTTGNPAPAGAQLAAPPDGYSTTTASGAKVTWNGTAFVGADGKPVDASTVSGVTPSSAHGVSSLGDAWNKVAGTLGVDPSLGLGGIANSFMPSLSSGSSAAVQAAISNTQNASQFYGNQLVNYNPVAAPVAQSPAAIQAAIAQQQAPIQAGTAAAQQAQAAQIAQTAYAQQQAQIRAQQVVAAQAARTTVAPAALAGTSQIAPTDQATQTQLAPVAQSTAAKIDPTQQAQFRAQQEGLAGSLQGTINGTTPSVAALMLRNATDNNVANQYALAQAANGMNAGMAQRNAMLNAGNINQQAIYQQALLRAQEIATAQGQLGGVLDQGRGADLSLATNQAGLQQQTALANQSATNTGAQAQLSADVQTKLANAGFVNTQQMTQAQLNQAIQLANAGFKNTAATTQAQLDAATAQLNAQLSTAASTSNASNALSASTTNATLAQQVALANAAATNTTNATNAGYQQAANLQNSQLGTQASIANANNTTSANTSSAQLANAVALANANNQSQANLTSGQLAAQTNIANANNAVSTNALNQKATNDLASNQLTASGQNVTAANNSAQADVGLADTKAKVTAGLLGAGGTLLGAVASDRRQKEHISDSEKEIAAFVRGINPYAWRYKKPDLPGAAKGRRYGVMAQELERSKVGRSMVQDGPDGVKRIDVGSAATVALAAISAMNKRLDRAGVR